MTDEEQDRAFEALVGQTQEHVAYRNPGSDEAISHGCTCPVLDNAHGRRDDGWNVMDLDCPLHGGIVDVRLPD
jgi:hypothetical protein